MFFTAWANAFYITLSNFLGITLAANKDDARSDSQCGGEKKKANGWSGGKAKAAAGGKYLYRCKET